MIFILRQFFNESPNSEVFIYIHITHTFKTVLTKKIILEKMKNYEKIK